MREIFGRRTQDALRFYPAGSPEAEQASARALGGDLTIIHSTWAWIEAQAATGKAEIFRFRFDRAPLTPRGWFGERDSASAGAFHAGEILYVFDNLPAFPWLISEEDRALAEIASSYWVNFVKTGDPNGPNLPPWPSFRSGAIMRLDATASAVAEDGRDRQIFLRDVAAAQEPGADGASSSRTS